jgi:hypothetical protein
VPVPRRNVSRFSFKFVYIDVHVIGSRIPHVVRDNTGHRCDAGLRSKASHKFVNKRNTSVCTMMPCKRDCLVQSAYLSAHGECLRVGGGDHPTRARRAPPRTHSKVCVALFSPTPPPPPHVEKRAATVAERERDRAPRSFHEPRAGLPGLHRKANEFRAAIISRE